MKTIDMIIRDTLGIMQEVVKAATNNALSVEEITDLVENSAEARGWTKPIHKKYILTWVAKFNLIIQDMSSDLIYLTDVFVQIAEDFMGAWQDDNKELLKQVKPKEFFITLAESYGINSTSSEYLYNSVFRDYEERSRRATKGRSTRRVTKNN